MINNTPLTSEGDHTPTSGLRVPQSVVGLDHDLLPHQALILELLQTVFAILLPQQPLKVLYLLL